MHNAFLVIRTVFFALLTYFHVLVLIFASWNIVAATSSGMSAPGASVFLLMNSVFIFVLVPVAYLAEVICVKARPAYVRVECAWTVLMSIFQLAASVDVTVNGPPMYCQTDSPWAMCASSSLLVHISWLATLIMLSYCLTICVTSATHATSLPDIWITPVPHVPWFHPDAEAPASISLHLPTHKHAKTSSSSTYVREASCAVSRYIAERWEKLSRTERQPVSSGPILFTKGHQSGDLTRPTWARQHRIRRGVDDPFAKPLPKRKEPEVLAPPPRTHSKQVMTPRDSHSAVEVGNQPGIMRTRSYSTVTPRISPVFPHRPVDPDLPIPRPKLSEWVRADVLSWITVDVEPHPSP
ncbi:hypothetical protein OG21DRAFT_341276 [Imleria badia]|nr:hypothetical protein OG21DRAFT_341276 [Imleria badia]